MIPLVDLVSQYHTIKDEIDRAVLDVLESGKFILGPNVTAFEQEIAKYLNVKHAVGVASGTDALVLALRAINVGAGDEVLVPAYSFFATAGAVLTLGAIPVFVDINQTTYLMDVNQLEKSLTPKTKAIIPVHLFGQPADMQGILLCAEKHNLIVIEDNAQAFGANYGEKKTGAIGHLGCLSFFPTKNLGGYGDGGMVTTNDDELAEKIRKLRTHGWKKKYFPETVGYNSRLDEIQAAILSVKLKYLDEWNARRRQIADEYTRKFAEFGLHGPVQAQDRTHVFFNYILRFARRTEIQQSLTQAGVATEIYFPQPLHLTTPCRRLGYKNGQLPTAEQASRELLALPIYPELKEVEIEKIVKSVRNTIKINT